MQHMPCSPDSKTRHKKKDTEHAAQAPTARHATRTRKRDRQYTPCSPGSKSRHKKNETEHEAHAPTAIHATRRRKQNMQHIIFTSETNFNPSNS
jgi:hypothetical protein